MTEPCALQVPAFARLGDVIRAAIGEQLIFMGASTTVESGMLALRIIPCAGDSLRHFWLRDVLKSRLWQNVLL